MKALLVLLLASVCAWGQDIQKPLPYDAQANRFSVDSKPLKCGKWEHVELRYKAVLAPNLDADGLPHDDYIPFYACIDDMHEVTEKEWQALMEKIRWIDHIRAVQCPSLSWVNGKCMPFCDEKGVYGSCAHGAGKE